MRKINAIFFATLILAANMGITVSTHYCGGMAVDKALTVGHETLGCAMNGMEDDCSHPKNDKNHYEDNCCDDEFATLEIRDHFTQSEINETLGPHFVFAYLITILPDIYSVPADYKAFTAYNPPDTNNNLTVLHRNLRL